MFGYPNLKYLTAVGSNNPAAVRLRNEMDWDVIREIQPIAVWPHLTISTKSHYHSLKLVRALLAHHNDARVPPLETDGIFSAPGDLYRSRQGFRVEIEHLSIIKISVVVGNKKIVNN